MQVIRPEKPLCEPGEDYNNGNITIIYKRFQIVAIREAIDEANYCTQDILFFCADAVPDLSNGLFSNGIPLRASDYELRDLSADGQFLSTDGHFFFFFFLSSASSRNEP